MKRIIFSILLIQFGVLSNAQTFSNEVPVGTVVAWAGNRAMLPKGWLVCDGSQISKDNFPKLCAILGNSWGPTDAELSVARLFYLPDLRGMFLRGVNEGRNDQYTDADSDKREYKNPNKPNNFQSNQVGSYQKNEFKSHDHQFQAPIAGAKVAHTSDGGVKANFAESSTNSKGGSETRPNNAYVYWIIKAK